MGIASPILPVSGLWARRLSRRPIASATVTLLCLGALVALLWGDRLAAPPTTFSGLQIVPLVAGGWLLGWRAALGLTAAGIATRLAAVAVAGVDPTSGAIEAFVALSVGLLAIAAADLAETRAETMGHLAGIAINSATAVRLEREHAEYNAELEAGKRDFLLLASHELRSPLAVARGYAAMLRDGTLGPPPPSFGRPLQVMEAKLDEIGVLVDDMLEAARLETGNLVLTQGDVDLRDVVQNAVETVRPAVTERHQLEVELPGRPVVVRGDTERLRRIAVNLLDNAVKYSPDGGPVHCDVGVAADGKAVLHVSDHGIGIPDDAMERMFRRFGRIVTPRTRGIPGTGLGLYLCRELARAHGGDITVESHEGRGSTFTLSLPAEAASIG